MPGMLGWRREGSIRHSASASPPSLGLGQRNLSCHKAYGRKACVEAHNCDLLQGLDYVHAQAWSSALTDSPGRPLSPAQEKCL